MSRSKWSEQCNWRRNRYRVRHRIWVLCLLRQKELPNTGYDNAPRPSLPIY